MCNKIEGVLIIMSYYFKSCYSEKIINGIKTRLFKKDENGENVFSDELNSMFNYSDEEFEKIFNGKTKLWLRKEMLRWRDNTSKEHITMKGTLNNLELLCFITKCEPNDILLEGITSKNISANTQYLSLGSIKAICKSLVDTYKDFNEDGFLNEPLLLPVEFSPTTLRFLFLKIYKDSNEVKMKFIVNEFSAFYEGIVPSNDNLVVYNVTSPKENKKLTLDLFYHEGMQLLSNEYVDDLYSDYILEFEDDTMRNILIENKTNDFFFQLYHDKLKYSKDYYW